MLMQGQGLDYEGKKITQVEIRYRGKPTVDEAALRNTISTRAGQTYSIDRLDADIKISMNPVKWMTCAGWPSPREMV